MTNHDDLLSHLLHALSDGTRRQMFMQVVREPTSISKLAAPSGLKLPTIMRHISVLEQCGLISTRKSGRERICSANPTALDPALHWMAHQRVVYDAQLDRQEKLVHTTKEE